MACEPTSRVQPAASVPEGSIEFEGRGEAIHVDAHTEPTLTCDDGGIEHPDREGHEFLVVDFAYQNSDDVEYEVGGDQWWLLVDGIPTFTYAVTRCGPPELHDHTKLPPHGQATGSVVYEVPPDKPLALWPSPLRKEPWWGDFVVELDRD